VFSVAALLIGSLLCLGQSPALAPAAAAPSCAARGLKTLRTTHLVRIFQKRSGDGWFVYGCVRPAGRSFRLGFMGGGFDDELDVLSIAGPHVAYRWGYAGENFDHFSVSVMDLRSGMVRSTTDDPSPAKIALHPSGAVAWTTKACLWDTRPRIPGAIKIKRPCRYVVKADALGTRVLEGGPDIAARSIRLSGRTVRWTRAGRTHSYVLRLP